MALRGLCYESGEDCGKVDIIRILLLRFLYQNPIYLKKSAHPYNSHFLKDLLSVPGCLCTSGLCTKCGTKLKELRMRSGAAAAAVAVAARLYWKSVAAWKSVLRQASQPTEAATAQSLRIAVLMLPQDLDALMSGQGTGAGDGVGAPRKQAEIEAEG